MRRALGTVAWLFCAGCTFTGLGRYDLGRCDDPQVPTSLADDPCRVLDDTSATCLRYQCNLTTGRCEQRVLDFDRDGDPAKECGGSDCDDHDPKRRTGGAEVCDGIDNDCNGVRDDAELVALTSTSIAALPSGFHDASLSGGIGAAVNGTCILALRASGELITPPCTFASEPGITPITPVARPITSGDVTFATAFVSAPLACPQGALSFRNTKGGRYDAACATEGATLPSLSPYRDGQVAVVTYVGRAYTPAVVDCARVTAAPLDVVWLAQPSAAEPSVQTQRLALASTLTTSAPPVVPRGDAMLLAAPADGAATLWSLSAPGTVVPLWSGMPDARTVDLALDDTGAHLALALEIGCAPQTRLVLVLADAVDPGPVVAMTHTVDIAAGGHLPRVAWIAGRNEWWVAWKEEAGLAVRRFTPDGLAASDAVAITPANVALGVPDPGASKGTSAVIDFVDASGLGAASLGCP